MRSSGSHPQLGIKAVFCTLDGSVLTEIRGLLTPPPKDEERSLVLQPKGGVLDDLNGYLGRMGISDLG